MASFPNTLATKLVVGTEIGAGVFVQKVPYENSLTGGLSVLNGPVVCEYFPHSLDLVLLISDHLYPLLVYLERWVLPSSTL